MAQVTFDSEDKDGLVYFIGNDLEGPIKIGYTSCFDPTVRLRQLQTACPYRLSVLGSIDGTVAKERTIQAFLMHDNVRGEWFKREPALAMLQHLTAQHLLRRPKQESFEQLWDIAINIGDGDLTLDEIEKGENEPVVSTIARHILLDTLNKFRDCHAEKPLPLLTWLINQATRDDAIGDLAKDACDDYNFPTVGSVFDYVNYLTNESMCSIQPAVTRTVIDAWIECQQAILHIK